MVMSAAEIKQELYRLNRTDLKSASYHDVKQKLEVLIEGLANVTGHSPGVEFFFRVRKDISRKPKDIMELHAPPGNLVTGYQRCNPPGTPMFYASSKRIGALIEARVQKDQIVYLGHWVSRPGMPVNRFFDSRENNLVAQNVPRQGPNDDCLWAYLDSQFTRRIHADFSEDYKITAAIAQLLTTNFFDENSKDRYGHVALKYPSVHSEENGYNTAMHYIFAKSWLSLFHVLELEITSVNANKIGLRVLDTAVDFMDGRIQWSGNNSILPNIMSDYIGCEFRYFDGKWEIPLFSGNYSSEYVETLIYD